ncbi:MAG: VOC family protein [Deltaproteobacteria bacterium]|nr:VOC family protein [Deltaproteobacteria bacterium]
MNELCWISLQVQDVEQSRYFWRDVVGLPEKAAATDFVELELRPGLHLQLHPVFHSPAMERSGYDRGGPMLGIRVMDLEQMTSLLSRHGARPLGDVQHIPGGRSRDMEDPDGYVFELVEKR